MLNGHLTYSGLHGKNKRSKVTGAHGEGESPECPKWAQKKALDEAGPR